MALLIKVDGTETTVQPANGKKFTMEEVYNLLDCNMIEPISLGGKGRESDMMLGDEDSRLGAESLNPKATALYRKAWGVTNPKADHAKMMAEFESEGTFVIDMVSMGTDEGHWNEPYTIHGNILVCKVKEF